MRHSIANDGIIGDDKSDMSWTHLHTIIHGVGNFCFGHLAVYVPLKTIDWTDIVGQQNLEIMTPSADQLSILSYLGIT